MAKENIEKNEVEVKDENKQPEGSVTLTKEQFDELLSKVDSAKSVTSTTSAYPIKPLANGIGGFVNKKEVDKDGNLKKYTRAERDYLRDMTYYEGYPDIRGGRVVSTGKLYSEDETYKDMMKGQSPVCMCGKCRDLDSLKQTAVMFVPHRGVWICDSCDQSYNKAFGGFERLVSRHLFARDVPFYGQSYKTNIDPMERRGLLADKRLDEYND